MGKGRDVIDDILGRGGDLNRKIRQEFQVRWGSHEVTSVTLAFRTTVKIPRTRYDSKDQPYRDGYISQENIIIETFAMLENDQETVYGLHTKVKFNTMPFLRKSVEDSISLLANCIANNLGDIVRAGSLEVYQKGRDDEAEAPSEPAPGQPGQEG